MAIWESGLGGRNKQLDMGIDRKERVDSNPNLSLGTNRDAVQ